MPKKSDKLEFAFAALPHAVLQDDNLCHTAKLLYAAIRSRCISQDYCQTPLKILADDINVSVSQVNRLMQKLKQVGLVRSVRTVRVSKIYPIHPKHVYEDVLSPFTSIRKKPVPESHLCDSGNEEMGNTESHSCDSPESHRCDSGIIRRFSSRIKLTNVSCEVAPQLAQVSVGGVDCQTSAQEDGEGLVSVSAGLSLDTAPKCMGDDDSVSSSGYKGPLRKPYSAPPTAINCSHKAPAKRVDVNPFTGQSKTPKTSKKPKGGRRKLGKGQQLFSLWNRWRELVQARFDVELKNPQPSGQDVGHLKNILTVCGDYDTVFDVMELICTDWGLIKQNWDWLAKGSPVPTLRMIDVIKTELYAITQGTTPLKTKQGAGKWYPRKAEKEDGGGYEMVMME